METIFIKEMQSEQLQDYKTFLLTGLENDGEQFRITPDDEAQAGFPTKHAADSFTLAAYNGETLAGVVSSPVMVLTVKSSVIREYFSVCTWLLNSVEKV